MIKEAEMKENAKIQAREIAKKRLDPKFQPDSMQAISSSDYQNTPAQSLDDMLNADGVKETKDTLKNYAGKVGKAKEAEKKDTFQQMLAAQEMKGVQKK